MTHTEDIEQQIFSKRVKLAALTDDLPSSDGGSYSNLRREYVQCSNELNALYQERLNLTLHTVVYPEWVRMQRNRLAVEVLSKERIKAAIEKMKERFK